MAATGTTRRPPKSAAASEDGGPAVVLVRPQLAENIGMAARAMLNCGLSDLRLVAPRDGWPNDKAVSSAAGADKVLQGARTFATTAEAVADLGLVYAATARPRDMTKDVVSPRAAAARMRGLAAAGGRPGVLFGRESAGLDNDDVALADAILAVPLNPTFRSLNLAQAVMVVAYEWYQAGGDVADSALAVPKHTRPANKAEMIGLFEHLENELDACGFLGVVEKRPTMVHNLRNLLQRARPTEQEVRTLRGVIKGLVSGRKGR